MFFPWAAPASFLRAIKFILNVNSSYSFEKFTPEAAFWRRGQDFHRIRDKCQPLWPGFWRDRILARKFYDRVVVAVFDY